MAIFSSNHSLDLYLPKSLGPCDFLPFFLINVFQKKSLLLREGLQKILYTDNTQPSHMCAMKEYLYYIMSMSHYPIFKSDVLDFNSSSTSHLTKCIF